MNLHVGVVFRVCVVEHRVEGPQVAAAARPARHDPPGGGKVPVYMEYNDCSVIKVVYCILI